MAKPKKSNTPKLTIIILSSASFHWVFGVYAQLQRKYTHIRVTYGFVCFYPIGYETYVFHLSAFIYDNRLRADDFQRFCVRSLALQSAPPICIICVHSKDDDDGGDGDTSFKDFESTKSKKKIFRLMFTIRLMWNMKISFSFCLFLICIYRIAVEISFVFVLNMKRDWIEKWKTMRKWQSDLWIC